MTGEINSLTEQFVDLSYSDTTSQLLIILEISVVCALPTSMVAWTLGASPMQAVFMYFWLVQRLLVVTFCAVLLKRLRINEAGEEQEYNTMAT